MGVARNQPFKPSYYLKTLITVTEFLGKSEWQKYNCMIEYSVGVTSSTSFSALNVNVKDVLILK